MTLLEAKEEIKKRINIVDFIGKDVNLKPSSSDNYVGLCPFHSEDTPSFHIRDKYQTYHCFGCGESGDIFSYVMKTNQMTFMQALDYFCNMLGITYDKNCHIDEKENKIKKIIYDIYKDVATEYFKLLFSDKGKDCLEYYKKRKLSFETIKRFGLGYAPNEKDYIYRFLKEKGYSDKEIIDDAKVCVLSENSSTIYDVWQNRAMFPILNRNNQVITFSGRILDENGKDKRKYVNGYSTDIFNKSENLFCLNFAQKTKEKYFILVEGNMDCISLYQSNFDNVVAPLGTAFTEKQAKILQRFKKQVYVALDSDEAGIKSIRTRTIPLLNQQHIDCKVVDLKPAKDPDEFITKFGRGALLDRIVEAKDSFLFEIDCMKYDYDLNEETGKRDYLSNIVKKIVSLNDKISQDVYIKSIALEIHMEEKELKEYVREYNSGLTDNKIFSKDKFKKINDKINEEKELVDKKEIEFIEILTDNIDLIDIVKKYLNVNELNNVICKEVYQDLLNGLTYIDLLNKYNCEDLDVNSDEKINKKFAADLISKSSNLDKNEAKKALSLIIKKLKILNIENKIKFDSNTDINNLLIKLKELKNANFEL